MTVKVRCPRCGTTRWEYRANVPEGASITELCDQHAESRERANG